MVNQEVETTGCGIATFANACGIATFAAARDWMQAKKLCKKNEFVTVPQMKSALELKTGKRITQHNSMASLSDNAVLFAEYEKDTIHRHWIFYKNGVYFDPLPWFTKGSNSIQYRVTRLLNIHG